MFAQDKMEEILSVMREIQELSTEHKSLNSVDTTEGTIPETTEKTVVINADPIPQIDTNQFNQMLGRMGRESMGSAFIDARCRSLQFKTAET
jgi:hypothetical protein